MNRSETKLLVENWRKVLNEGLYDSDPEILAEINLKKAVQTGSFLTMLFLSTLGAKSASAESPLERFTAQAEQAIGKPVPASSLYRHSKPAIEKAVNTCIDKRIEEIKSSFKEDVQFKKWLSAYETVLKVPRDEVFDKGVIPAIREAAAESCFELAGQLVEDVIASDSGAKEYYADWDQAEKAKASLKQTLKSKGINPDKLGDPSSTFKTNFLEEILDVIMENLGEKFEEKLWRRCIEKTKEKLKDLVDVDDPTKPKGFSGLIKNLFKKN
jgi:hypothetical protein